MTTENHIRNAHIDVHKGNLVCFIPCREWLDLPNPPAADMWMDRENLVWAGMDVDDLVGADFTVEVPTGELRNIEWLERGHGFVLELKPLVFDEGIQLTLEQQKRSSPEPPADNGSTTPGPGM